MLQHHLPAKWLMWILVSVGHVVPSFHHNPGPQASSFKLQGPSNTRRSVVLPLYAVAEPSLCPNRISPLSPLSNLRSYNPSLMQPPNNYCTTQLIGWGSCSCVLCSGLVGPWAHSELNPSATAGCDRPYRSERTDDVRLP